MAFTTGKSDIPVIKMQEELSCSICYNILNEPKVLDCQHVYCLQCLVDYVGEKFTIECPGCRQVTTVPQGGLTDLKFNLRLKSMVEIYKEVVDKQISIPMCQVHEGERQHFFCVTCNTSICRNCVAIKHPRSEHEIEELKDIVKSRKVEMTKKLNLVNEEVQKNDANEKKLDEIQAQIQSAQALAESEIDERARNLIAQVEAKREEIKKQIQETSQKNLKTIQDEKNRVTDRGKRLQNLHSASQNLVDTAADHVFMKQHVVLVEKMEKLCNARHELSASDMACLHFNPGSDPVSSVWFMGQYFFPLMY